MKGLGVNTVLLLSACTISAVFASLGQVLGGLLGMSEESTVPLPQPGTQDMWNPQAGKKPSGWVVAGAQWGLRGTTMPIPPF